MLSDQEYQFAAVRAGNELSFYSKIVAWVMVVMLRLLLELMEFFCNTRECAEEL